jgi:hypothetical protein
VFPLFADCEQIQVVYRKEAAKSSKAKPAAGCSRPPHTRAHLLILFNLMIAKHKKTILPTEAAAAWALGVELPLQVDPLVVNPVDATHKNTHTGGAHRHTPVRMCMWPAFTSVRPLPADIICYIYVLVMNNETTAQQQLYIISLRMRTERKPLGKSCLDYPQHYYVEQIVYLCPHSPRVYILCDYRARH